MPKISVIVPVYNGEKYIKKNYNSLKNQTYKDFEIIYVNDGSSDNSLNILNQLAQEDERIIVINQTNKGVSQSRNAGLVVAKGEYIQFLDVDDYLEDNCFSKSICVLEKYSPDIYRYQMDFKYKKLNLKSKLFFESDKLLSTSDIYENIFCADDLCSSCSGMIKTTIAKKNTFDSNYIFGEDFLYMIDCLIDSNTIYFSNEALYNYAMNDESITHIFDIQKIIKILESALSVNKKIEEMIFEEKKLKVSRVDKSTRNINIYLNKGVENLNYKDFIDFTTILKTNSTIGNEINYINSLNGKLNFKLLNNSKKEYAKVKFKRFLKKIIKVIVN